MPKEKEATTPTSKLPTCSNQLRGHLASLRPVKPIQWPSREPFSHLENTLTTSASHFTKKVDECFSPEIAKNLYSTTPCILGQVVPVSKHQ